MIVILLTYKKYALQIEILYLKGDFENERLDWQF